MKETFKYSTDEYLRGVYEKHRNKARTDQRSHFPVGGDSPTHQSYVPGGESVIVRGQKGENENPGESIREAGGEDTPEAHNKEPVQGVEKKIETSITPITSNFLQGGFMETTSIKE